ncbi:hypothetical protein CHU67_00385 [Corynebacterium sp. LK19]|uniref:hypothetical protein n=1 Tax=Corynebacterium sp. LK19 TaxID=2022660 RepID=UPI0011C94CBA|nr:hypothetical protein [Corynebacterium sp. LK19]TXS60885.1 hypothetical protein CHU67_00385 [Corynebacterium sp. LK19]
MRLSDQIRALEEENTRLRAALAAEQDKRRKWQGAFNRVEDAIARETRHYQTQVEAADNAGDHTAMRLAEAGRIAVMVAITYITDARAEARAGEKKETK